MSVAFVVRLLPDALAKREIAGRIEAVQTGEYANVRTPDELIAFMYEQAQLPADATSTHREE